MSDENEKPIDEPKETESGKENEEVEKETEELVNHHLSREDASQETEQSPSGATVSDQPSGTTVTVTTTSVTSAEEKPAEKTQSATNTVPVELLVKHPLQYRWVLWYCKQDRNKEWTECLKEVAKFDTVEDFWALYNHIQLASGLTWQSDYYLFKEGVQPMWEDPQNVDGGRWLVMVDKMRRNELLDHYWLELLMAMIGEQFDEYGEQICGAVVNVRNKGDKVSLWTRDAGKDEINVRIGNILKEKLGIKDMIRYEAHKAVSEKQSSMAKPKLQI